MKLDPYIRNISDYEKRLADAIIAQSCIVYLDTSALMWGLRVNALARKEFIDWCRSFGGQLRVPVWAAHELQRHLIDDSVQETIKKRSSACERQFNDFISLIAERSDDSIARVAGAGSSGGLITDALLIQSQIKKMSSAIRSGDLCTAYEEIIEFVNESVMDSDLREIAEVLSTVGDFRYTHRVPPGFKDGAKSENRYGDLVIWEEILRDSIARDSCQVDNACIFISQDEKADWISSSPWVEGANGRKRSDKNRAEDVPLAHPLLQHEYKKRGGSGAVFVVTPRRLSIIASIVARSKPEFSGTISEWRKVSYHDWLAKSFHGAVGEDEGRSGSPETAEPQVQTPTVAKEFGTFPAVNDVFTGSISSRLKKTRDLGLEELNKLLDKWLSEVQSNRLKPHLFGRLLASHQRIESITVVGTYLAKARQQFSDECNARIHFGFGVALYFQQIETLRVSPSKELGEIFLKLCQSPFFAEGLSILAEALRKAGLAETFIPGSKGDVSFDITSSGSSGNTLTDLRIDGTVVTQTVSKTAGKRLVDYLRDGATTASADELIALVGQLFLIDRNRIKHSYKKSKFEILPEMGFVELDFSSPQGFQFPFED